MGKDKSGGRSRRYAWTREELDFLYHYSIRSNAGAGRSLSAYRVPLIGRVGEEAMTEKKEREWAVLFPSIHVSGFPNAEERGKEIDDMVIY